VTIVDQILNIVFGREEVIHELDVANGRMRTMLEKLRQANVGACQKFFSH
jgi:hypothetical protein